MRLAPYRRALAVPGVRALLVTALLARVPVSATGVVLVLHVVLPAADGGLGRGYAEAGLVGAVFAVGAAVGSPLQGRLMDRHGVRRVVAVGAVVEVVFWSAVTVLPYGALLPAALLGGLLGLPVFAVVRQAVGARLRDEDRQAGFALDSMAVELSFAVGPALGVVATTALGTRPALLLVAGCLGLAGAALAVLDPPVAEAADVRAGEVPDGHVPLRQWLSRPVAAVLLATTGATVALTGTDVSITALMRALHQTSLIGVVVAAWCLASLVGGFVYGALHRGVDAGWLLLLLAGLTVPVALARSWPALLLLVVPTGLFCAPLLSTTADQVVRRTPPAVRGTAMGTHASALTVGNALGGPVAGLAVDGAGPRAGFVAVGLAGSALAVLALLLRRSTSGPPVDRVPAAAPAERPAPVPVSG